jgi:diguanylate cyclase (GGDEF)-like protein
MALASVVPVVLVLAGGLLAANPIAAALLCGAGMLYSMAGAWLIWREWRHLDQSRQNLEQALSEAQNRHKSLLEALDVLPDAMAIYDPEDRLVLATQRYRDLNPATAHLMQRGVRFEEIIRAAVAAEEIVDAKGREEEWIQNRLAEHRSPRQDFLQALSNQRWVRVNEQRTPDGGLIGLRTDVSELIRQQRALQEARQDAHQARRLLERALDALPVALEIFDENDRLVAYNRALQTVFAHIDYPNSIGHLFVDMARRSLYNGVIVEAVGQEEAWLAQRLKARDELIQRSYLQSLSGGRWVQVYERRTPERYIVAIRVDVTDAVNQRHALEAAQRESQANRQLLLDALEALPEGVAVYDAQDCLLLCNTQYRLVYKDLSPVLQPGTPFENLVNYAVTHRHYHAAHQPGRPPQSAVEWGEQRLHAHRNPGTPMVIPMGDGRWLRVHERKTADNMTVGVHVDVTELIEKEQQLAKANDMLATLSVTDGLTGIHNRRSFDEAIARDWMRCARHRLPLALLLVDIDHFKLYNDHYGHLAGDDCLRRVARLLASDAKRAGELVARYGGEEFVMLLPGCTEEDAREVAQRCLEQVRTENIPHAASPTSTRLTLSIGAAACIPEARRQSHGLINAADAALYHAKQTGRARYVLASTLAQP